ncbi:glycosyltransferase WbuB [Clostridiaceae bacterium]|jgi:glycosyltransferase involved in cell wall biosynthesis|nr:glycosyltransferase WbuB [Clostridiaceae bacterium]
MNILLLNHYAGSVEMGMEFRPYYFAREWVKMGYSVRIAAGDFSHLRMKNPQVIRDFQEEVIDGIHYHWIRTGDYKRNGARRAATMFRFVGKLWLKARWIARNWKPDVIIASSTYPLDTYAAQRIGRFSGARVIHEVHDMWPSTLYEIGGMSRQHPFVALMQAAENSAYRHSAYVVSLLPFAKKYMLRHGMKAGQFVHIPNGVELDEWKNQDPLPENLKTFFRKTKETYPFIVGYFGGHAISNALDALLDAAKEMQGSGIAFVLAGNGCEKERLISRKQNEIIDNLYFLEPVSRREIPALVSNFDCIYMGAHDSPLYRFGICMNKLYDSLMAGKPIVCAVTVRHTIIEQYKAGIRVNSGDIAGIVSAITELAGMDSQERKQMGLRGKKAVQEHFEYHRLAKQFAVLFEE